MKTKPRPKSSEEKEKHQLSCVQIRVAKFPAQPQQSSREENLAFRLPICHLAIRIERILMLSSSIRCAIPSYVSSTCWLILLLTWKVAS
ncbi:hypothetical protein AVEN_46875-1 [Araneus ventricosus]|uniref:Uncharacterized protein n=1 Tax=Araneus ventricosus TaxID=182803 RepID=A0A4Y2CN29_ARAVE|nr:hypothetical protein AVEN_46875-1 [Araneus ventricosus]